MAEAEELLEARKAIDAKLPVLEAFAVEIEAYLPMASTGDRDQVAARALQRAREQLAAFQPAAERDVKAATAPAAPAPPSDQCLALNRTLREFWESLATVPEPMSLQDASRIAPVVHRAQASRGYEPRLLRLQRVVEARECTKLDIDEARDVLGEIEPNKIGELFRLPTIEYWRRVLDAVKATIAELNHEKANLDECRKLLDQKSQKSTSTTDTVLTTVVLPLIITLVALYVLTRIFSRDVQHSLIRTRTLIEIVGIAFLLITIISLGSANKLGQESLGTLLGSIATYIFGRQLFGAPSAKNGSAVGMTPAAGGQPPPAANGGPSSTSPGQNSLPTAPSASLTGALASALNPRAGEPASTNEETEDEEAGVDNTNSSNLLVIVALGLCAVVLGWGAVETFSRVVRKDIDTSLHYYLALAAVVSFGALAFIIGGASKDRAADKAKHRGAAAPPSTPSETAAEHAKESTPAQPTKPPEPAKEQP